MDDMPEKVGLKVEGMTCSNCALTVSKFLQKEGLGNVKVNPIDGEVSFENIAKVSIDKIKKGINNLGYSVKEEEAVAEKKKSFLSGHKNRFFFCLPFTLVLMLHMVDKWVHIHWLMNPWVQLILCLPVFIVGMNFFGKSALKSLRNGMPNMNVLVALGSMAAFVYSLTGAILHLGQAYLFFETAASIITLVFLGNYMEEASIQSTQKAVKALVRSQKVMANMIAFDEEHKEIIFPIENTQLKVGDLLLIKNGEQVPIDCKILWGDCAVNESIITGESLPLNKSRKDMLIGGSLLANGTIKAQVTATGKDTVLSGILQMVKNAQGEKPPMQKLADKISAIFVPVVIALALITFTVSYLFFDISAGESLLRSIAVLVISCPCAMGLATPAAIAVGLGRAAKNGILFRNATSLETFKSIGQVVFDKTGTLTTGTFKVSGYQSLIDEEMFKKIAFSLEKYSNHPIAKCITSAYKTNTPIIWTSVEEVKGLGIKAKDRSGDEYFAGSYKGVLEKTAQYNHNVFITRNNELIGWIDVEDEIREEAKSIIEWFHDKNIRTILLSGDKKEKCEQVAAILGIDTVIAEQTPEQKLKTIEELNKQMPTAMVGDGINDAPALAKATLGISLSEASQIAVQSADVILMNHGIKKLPLALGLGKHTYITIKQNLFWAFFYNIIAIPIAAFGFLTPTFSALAMGLSDVVLGINSVRLFVKKVL